MTAAESGSPRWGRILTAAFVAAALLFAGLLLFGQWQELRRLGADVGGYGWRLSAGWLAAALALATLNLFLMGAAWVRLYRAAGGTVRYRRGVGVWVATNLGRYIPGKVWQLSGLAVHLRESGESGSLGLASALAFQVVVLVTGIAVAAGVLGADLALVPGGSPAVAAAAVLLLLGLLHPRVVRGGMRLAARVLDREEAPDAAPPTGPALLRSAGGMVAAWGLYGVGLWCLVRGLSASVEAGPVLLTGVFAAAYVAGYLVLVAPGGLLVREGAMTGLLAALTPMGAAVAGAVAVAARIWVTVAEIAAAAFSLALPGRGTDRTAGGGSGRGRGEAR